MKRIILVLLLICSGIAAVASDEDERYNNLGLKIQCACGCGQILIKCNHVGCPSSDGMIRQLRAAVNNYSNDEDVLNFFRKSYGMTVVVAPSTHGFELTIWIMPLVLAAIGLMLLVIINRRWRSRAAPVGVVQLDPGLEDLKYRARKETEI